MKKRFLLFLVLALALLSACKGINISTAPAAPPVQVGADADLATKVAQILTVAATQAIKPAAVDPAAKGPIGGDATVQPTLAPTATLEPSPTPTLVPTQVPTAEPTQAPTQTAAPVQTATIIPTAVQNITPIAASTEDPRSRLGPPTAGDAMDSAASWIWPSGSDQYTSAQWVNGSMRVTALTTTAGWRLPVVGPFGDVYIDMTVRHSRT